MIASPPLSAGGTNVRVISALPSIASGVEGAAGTVEGTAGEEGGDSGPVPSAFAA